jgi:hypothetical protein
MQLVKSTDMRLLSPPARLAKRLQVVGLRQAGGSYLAIAAQTGLSRTGVFDICKRHLQMGLAGMSDLPVGRVRGQGRHLTPAQESLVCALLAEHSPDELGIPALLWSHQSVALLLKQRLQLVLPLRTLDDYLSRWGYDGRWPGLALIQRRLALARPGLAARARREDAAVLWGHVQTLKGSDGRVGEDSRTVLSSRNAKREVLWLIVAKPPSAAALIDFMGRLIRTLAGRKVLLLLRPTTLLEDMGLNDWLAERIDSIELLLLPT